MGEVIHEWIEQSIINDLVMREEQVRLVVRDRPRWLPERLWRWLLRRLLTLEVRSR